MPGQVRQGDDCTGHGCWPPRKPSSWMQTVTANGKPKIVVSNTWAEHCCPTADCHVGTQASGSPNVFAGGKAVARIGDKISCGSSNAQGSGNVIIN